MSFARQQSTFPTVPATAFPMNRVNLSAKNVLDLFTLTEYPLTEAKGNLTQNNIKECM